MHKPHKGKIAFCNKTYIPNAEEHTAKHNLKPNLGYYYNCDFIDHHNFAGRSGWTSVVVSEDGDEIETLNSRYTIVSRLD